MEKLSICKRFKFDAAHRLPNYKGKCSNLHGHRWVVEVEISGTINGKSGMVCDFTDLNGIVQDYVINFLDHTYLNDLMENPTAEQILCWILNTLEFGSFIPSEYSLKRLRLYESEDSYVEWRNE